MTLIPASRHFFKAGSIASASTGFRNSTAMPWSIIFSIACICVSLSSLPSALINSSPFPLTIISNSLLATRNAGSVISMAVKPNFRLSPLGSSLAPHPQATNMKAINKTAMPAFFFTIPHSSNWFLDTYLVFYHTTVQAVKLHCRRLHSLSQILT